MKTNVLILTLALSPELSLGRIDPLVGSGRVETDFLKNLVGRVGSGHVKAMGHVIDPQKNIFLNYAFKRIVQHSFHVVKFSSTK